MHDKPGGEKSARTGKINDMRINARNLNKKPEPIVFKRREPLKTVLFVLVGLVLLAPVAVLIIGMVSAVAIPSLLSSRKAANEASAIQTLRNYHTAEVTYYAAHNERFAAPSDLSTLLAPELAREPAVKNGYRFKVTVSPSGKSYCAIAAPEGKAGASHFGVSGDGVIYKASTPIACENGNLTGDALVELQ
jgi:type II secretory pathway pseudopilin PulG